MIDPNYPNYRPYRGNDRPTQLQRISDADKAKAIADAVREIAKQEWSVEILAIDYSTRPWEKGSFRWPVRKLSLLVATTGDIQI